MEEPDARTDEILSEIVDAAGVVRRVLGVGLLERVYRDAMVRELTKRGRQVEREVRIPVRYDGEFLDGHYLVDLCVDGIVVELKACVELHPSHYAQTLTYVRLTEGRVGLLINFHAVPLRNGIHRLILRRDA